jgi:molecular chaperone DnaK (HSP70)
MALAVGIDLGTVFSCVGVFRDGNVEIIANAQGNRITPSVVAFTERGRLVGDAAKNQIELNTRNTIYGKINMKFIPTSTLHQAFLYFRR